MKQRASGILMHISSLPGPYGIGDFGKAAYDFVDFLVDTETKYWQILPLGITGYGDSPYQSFSAFAGNPYFIDLKELIEEGYLSDKEVEDADLGDDPERVDFGKLYENKMPLLHSAFEKSREALRKDLETFYKEEENWLHDFALFMAIKGSFGGISWQKWPDEYRKREEDTLKEFEETHEEEIMFWVFTQYWFFRQWRKLKGYANSKGIKIVGDIPIYVAEDGADIWSEPELFLVEKDLRPTCVAGCPPDAFTDLGQLWGNPIYDWNAMKKDGYRWWLKRIRESFRIYDTVRIDHFRGFESYWEIPAGSENAVHGKWVKGPGMDLFTAIREELGDLDFMAENLGFMTDDVVKLIEDAGYPGMNVLIFAFDPDNDSEFLPHNNIRNSVVYTTNHDSPTSLGFLKSARKEEFEFARKYFRLNKEEGYHWGFIRGAWTSPSYLAVAPTQDLLGLDDSARFNVPSTLGNNWVWRMKEGSLTKGIRTRLRNLNRTYRRSLCSGTK